MTKILEIENVSKKFDSDFFVKKTWALKKISLEVNEGEIFGLLGPNGAGKTTTIKLILGLLKPTNGKIMVLSKDPTDTKTRQNIGYVSENPYCYDYLTGNEMLFFMGKLSGMDETKINARIEKVINLVGLKNKGNIRLKKYSKGMLTRLSMAQAIIHGPKLLILDEPMSGLDPIGRREIRNVILQMKNKGTTIFMSTHILDDVEMICDRIGIINKGNILKVEMLKEFMKKSIDHVSIKCRLAKDLDFPKDVLITRIGHQKQIICNQKIATEMLNKILSNGGIIDEVIQERTRLEEAFINEIEDFKVND